MSREADYRDLGRFGVMVHTSSGAMTSEDFEYLRDAVMEHGPRLRFLVVWADGTLTPTQRQERQKLQVTLGYTSLLFTESAVTRGVAKVLQWFGVKIRAEAKSRLTEV